MLMLANNDNTPEIIGHEYLVLGTLTPSAWRKREKEPITMKNAQANVHDFKDYLDIKPAYR